MNVHKDRRKDETELELCSETKSKMKSKDEVMEPRVRAKSMPIPLEMLSLQVVITRAVNVLVRRVYNHRRHNDTAQHQEMIAGVGRAC